MEDELIVPLAVDRDFDAAITNSVDARLFVTSNLLQPGTSAALGSNLQYPEFLSAADLYFVNADAQTMVRVLCNLEQNCRSRTSGAGCT